MVTVFLVLNVILVKVAGIHLSVFVIQHIATQLKALVLTLILISIKNLFHARMVIDMTSLLIILMPHQQIVNIYHNLLMLYLNIKFQKIL